MLGIILGGALSNLIDRVFLGGVRDFIYLKFINFAIFNVADMAVSLGAITFCILYFIHDILLLNMKNKSDNNGSGDSKAALNENNQEIEQSSNELEKRENNNTDDNAN